MNSLELKGARVRRGYTQTAVAEALGMSVPTYCKKEQGNSYFSDNQKKLLIGFLGLSLQEANDIFYDGELPSGTIGK